jgi:hypothetical protein
MSHERYTRTNQKLFYAGLALESWREAEKSGAFNAPARVQACREECLFHLYGAALGLCHEVAGYYRLDDDSMPSVELFLSRERQERSPSPEMAELIELAASKETWLHRLLNAYGALYLPPVAPSKPKQDPTIPLIQTINVGEGLGGDSQLQQDELEYWRNQIKIVALRFREGLSEI